MFTNLELVSSIVAIISVLISVLAVLVALRSRSRKIQLHISEELKPKQQVGLIVLVGPSKGSTPAAIEYHLPTLQYCWLIGTDESLETIQHLIKTYENVTFYWGGKYSVKPDEIGSTYNTVSRILSEDVTNLGLQISEMIADITGGLKPMAAGISLACTNYECKMQYMKAPRDESGAIIYGGLPEPVKVDIALGSGT